MTGREMFEGWWDECDAIQNVEYWERSAAKQFAWAAWQARSRLCGVALVPEDGIKESL